MRAILLTSALLLAATSARAQDDRISYRKLTRPETIGGVACAPTGRAKAGVYASGRLESCPIATSMQLQQHRLPSGSWIYLGEDGSLRRAWLPQDTEIQGHRCRGTGYKGWSVDFHPNGSLKLCFLAAEQVIQGVPCRKGSFWGELTGGVYTSFRDNGSLESCAAARDFDLGGRRYKGRERVLLGADGAASGG